TTILVSRRGSDGDGHAADREIERCGNRRALAGAESSEGSPGPVERRVRPGEEDESFAGSGRASVGYAQARAEASAPVPRGSGFGVARGGGRGAVRDLTARPGRAADPELLLRIGIVAEEIRALAQKHLEALGRAVHEGVGEPLGPRIERPRRAPGIDAV